MRYLQLHPYTVLRGDNLWMTLWLVLRPCPGVNGQFLEQILFFYILAIYMNVNWFEVSEN